MQARQSRPQRITIPIENHRLVVQITDDDSRTLIDPATGVACHSASGAAAETRHVYLENSGVAKRLADRAATSVLEVGLGTGMGMLMTLQAAIDADAPLHYTALENQWPAASVLEQLRMEEWVSDRSLVNRFLAWRRSLGEIPSRGAHRWQPGQHQSIVVHHGDALDFDGESRAPLDAIYFDPFAPEVNAELWQTEFVRKMHGLLGEQGRLVTYCVNRKVREVFANAGFDVRRVPGPAGGKREVMVACKKGL